MLQTSLGLLKNVMLGQDPASIKDVIEGTFGSKDEIKGKISGFAGSVEGKAAIGAAITVAMNESIQ